MRRNWTNVSTMDADNNDKFSLLLKKYRANNNPLIPPISNFNVKKHCRQENVLSKAQQTISPFLRILAV